MKTILIADIAPAPWKNGGGVTREIALAADDRGMIWRLSVADVARAGPFSSFRGLSRALTVIDGKGLLLRHEGGVIEAVRGEPVRFPGDMPIDCDLLDGPVRDFNLIFDPERVAADVIWLGKGIHEVRGVGLLALEGTCIAAAEFVVDPGSFLLFGDEETRRIAVDGAALLVSLA